MRKTIIRTSIRSLVIPMLAGLAVIVGSVFGQGVFGRGIRNYDAKSPPPLDLMPAYVLARNYLGSATNDYWCVAASCPLNMDTNFITHWEFSFTSRNGKTTNVLVLFDKTIAHRVGATLVR